jgi:hypothetical protein
VDPAYIAAGVVVLVCIGLLALLIRNVSRPKPITPFSDDGHWWWDGKQWQLRISRDGLWLWDGFRWNPYRADGGTDSTSESLARGLINPNPGARFALETTISLIVGVALFAISAAVNPITHQGASHVAIGAVGFAATRYLLSRRN